MYVTNVIGQGPYSDELKITFAEVPDAPAAPTYVARSSGDSSIGLEPFITIQWTAPEDSNGSEILGYVIYVKEDAGAFNVLYDGSTNPDLLQYKFQDGLTAGLPYTFKVQARNAMGYSADSATLLVYAAEMPPAMDAPTIDSITVAGSASEIDISWSVPTETGGSAITGYYVAINDGYGTEIDTPGTLLGAGVTSHTFSGLLEGVTYEMSIAAVNLIYTTDNRDDVLNFSEAAS